MKITPDVLAHYQPNTVRALGFPKASLFFLQIVDAARFRTGLGLLRRSDLLETGRPARSARATLAFSAEGLRALAIPSALIGCLGDAFNQGMAARAEQLRDRDVNAPECWQYPFGTGLVHALLVLYVPQSDERPDEILAQALNRPETETQTLFAERLGARLLHVEQGQRRYLGKGRDQAPVNALGFVDGLSQPVRHDAAALLDDFVLRTPAAKGRRNAPPLAPPWSEVLESASQSHPEQHERYAALAHALIEASHLMVYRKIGISPKVFAASADAVADATGLPNRRAQELLMGRRRNGMPLGTRQGGGLPRLRQHNDFDFLDDPDGQVHPRSSHVRRSNPRRDRNGEVGLAHQGQNIRPGADGLPVGLHNMLRRGISFRDHAHDPAEGLHFMALVSDLERQFEFVQREWLNKGDFVGQPSDAVDPIAATSSTHTKFRLAGKRPSVRVEIPTRLHGGEYFLVPGQRLLRHLSGRTGAEPLPELAVDPLAIFSKSAPRNPEKLLEPVARLSLTRQRVVPMPNGFAVARWADCLDVLNRHDDFSSEHYLKRIRVLTNGADFALGMPAGPAHSRQRQDIAALLCPHAANRRYDRLRLPEDRMVDLLADVVWPRLVGLAENLFGITVPEEPEPIAIGDELGDVVVGRYRSNYREDLDRYFKLDPSRRRDRKKIKALNLASAVRRMGIYVIGFSESDGVRRRAVEGADTFRTWLNGGPGALDEAVAQGLAVAACGTLEKAAALVLDRVIGDPAAAAALRSGAGGELADEAMLRTIVLEALRLAPVLPIFERDAVRDVQLAGVTIPRGRRVTVLASGALRDGRRFGEDADRFSTARAQPADGTMLFGYGIHFCSGDETALRFLVSLLRDLFSRYDLLPAAGRDANLQYANAISNQPIALNVRVRRR